MSLYGSPIKEKRARSSYSLPVSIVDKIAVYASWSNNAKKEVNPDVEAESQSEIVENMLAAAFIKDTAFIQYLKETAGKQALKKAAEDRAKAAEAAEKAKGTKTIATKAKPASTPPDDEEYQH